MCSLERCTCACPELKKTREIISPTHFLKRVRSYVHFCQRPCESTYRWTRLSAYQHKGTTHCAVRGLTPTLAVLPQHECDRQKIGLSPSSRTCSKILGARTATRVQRPAERQQKPISPTDFDVLSKCNFEVYTQPGRPVD